MWLLATLVAQAHTPRSNVIELVEQRTLSTRPGAPWAIEPVGEDGLVVWTENTRNMVARRYDPDLSLRWSVPLPEIVDGAPAITLARDGVAWAVFQVKALAIVTRFEVEDGAMRSWVVPLEHRARRVVDFETVGDDAWLVMVDGRSSEGGGLRYLDLETGASSKVTLPPVAQTIELQRLTAAPERGVVDVTYRTAVLGRFTQHIAVAKEGRLFNDLVLQVPDLNLLDAQRAAMPDGTTLVVGTYADESTGTRAQGFYAARLGAERDLTYVATHSFTSLGHFFDDLPPARRKARRRQVAALAERGADLDVDLRFSMHDLQHHEGRIVVSGEAYAPRLGTTPRVVAVDVDGTYGRRTQAIDVVDGFWFTHALVVAFDPDGSIAWDASLPMENVGDTTIRPHVRVGVHGGVATLAYSTGDAIVSRVFHRGTVVEEAAQRALVPYDRSALRKQPMTVEPWFGSQWLSYGLQRQRTGGRTFVIERLQASANVPDGPPTATLTPIH